MWLDLLTWNAIVAFSEQCEAKLVHEVLLLYLATRTLAIANPRIKIQENMTRSL